MRRPVRPSRSPMRCCAAAVVAVVLIAAGCGDGGEPPQGTAPARAPTPKRSATAERFSACLARAGVTITRSPERVAFLRGTSLYGQDPSAGTDVVSVGRGHAAVSFQPESGDAQWRVYTLSVVRGSQADQPPYEAIWRTATTDPAALEVVGVDVTGTAKTTRCLDVVSGLGPE